MTKSGSRGRSGFTDPDPCLRDPMLQGEKDKESVKWNFRSQKECNRRESKERGQCRRAGLGRPGNGVGEGKAGVLTARGRVRGQRKQPKDKEL